jgi:hypothetical protein
VIQFLANPERYFILGYLRLLRAHHNLCARNLALPVKIKGLLPCMEAPCKHRRLVELQHSTLQVLLNRAPERFARDKLTNSNQTLRVESTVPDICAGRSRRPQKSYRLCFGGFLSRGLSRQNQDQFPLRLQDFDSKELRGQQRDAIYHIFNPSARYCQYLRSDICRQAVDDCGSSQRL